MRNHRLLLQIGAGLGCLASLLLAAILACGIAWPALRPTPTPKVRPFGLRELFVDLPTVSPDCWIYEGPRPLTYEENAGAEEALFAWFQCGSSGGGMYAIYRFQNSQAAARRYRNMPMWFTNAMRVTPYKFPNWMRYQSLIAQKFRFACAEFQGYTTIWGECAYLGQYEQFIVGFTIGISPPESIADYASFLEGVLRAIDDRMKDYLSR